MLLMVECDGTRIPGLRYGKFKGTINGKRFVRFWWKWFAVAYYAGDLKEYTDTVRSGKTEWKNA